MSAALSALPPYRILAAALRKTTEHLAREVACSSETPPDWNDLEWGVARSVATMQGISVLLANRLRWRGPPAWESHLARQREQSVLREALIDRLLERIDAAARSENVGYVALKGSALRVLGVYAAGERPQGDIDLLVSKSDSARIARAMRALDYDLVADVERHDIYAPRVDPEPRDLGEHVDNPVPIEVHTAVAEPLPVQKIDITRRLTPSEMNAGVNAYASRSALLLHLLLHAAGNMKAHAFRQLQLHDVAVLSARFDDADWQALLDIARTGDGLWWAFPPMELALRYYDCPVPSELMHVLRRSCPRVLRSASERNSLTDVSWSNLRFCALPGIAWARTLTDALRYVKNRALPSSATFDIVRTSLERQPQLQQVRWYQLSQAERIVRLLVSRPPRVQTITSLSAALLHPNS